MKKFPSPNNRYIQQVYGDIETANRKKRKSKHKLTKREFMKGFNRKEEPEKIDDKKEDS